MSNDVDVRNKQASPQTSDKFSTALESQLSCKNTPVPAKAIGALQRAGIIERRSYFVIDSVNYFRVRRPLTVWGIKVVSVFGFDFNPRIFERGPGTAPYITLGVVVPVSERNVKAKLSSLGLENIAVGRAAELELDSKRIKSSVLTEIYCEERGQDKSAPSDSEMRLATGDALKNLGRYAEAAEEYEKESRINPNDAYAHYQLSWTYLYLGLGEKAAIESQSYLRLKGCRDFTGKPDLTPYARFVSYFGYRQAGLDFHARRILEEGGACAEKSTWTYLVLRYLLREVSANELLEQAKEKEQMVEAQAYIGMTLSLDRRREEALPYLRWVTSNGTKDFAEYFLALSEIQRIEAAR